MKKLDTKIIIISGFLIALNIVLSRIIAIPGIINFGGFSIIFGGLVFGPVVGGIIGTIGDIASHIVRPTGPFMPHFVLTSALTGIIPAIVVRSLKINLAKPSLWKIMVSIFVGQMVTSVVMVPYFLNTLFNIPLTVSMVKAGTKQIFNIPAYSIMIKILLPILYKTGALTILDKDLPICKKVSS